MPRRRLTAEAAHFPVCGDEGLVWLGLGTVSQRVGESKNRYIPWKRPLPLAHILGCMEELMPGTGCCRIEGEAAGWEHSFREAGIHRRGEYYVVGNCRGRGRRVDCADAAAIRGRRCQERGSWCELSHRSNL